MPSDELREALAATGPARGRRRGGPADSPTLAAMRGVTRTVWFWRTVCWGLLVVAWEIAAAQLGSQILPSFKDIIGSGVPKAFSEGYYVDFLTTLEQLAIGFGIASAIAIALGLVMGRSELARDLVWPLVNGLYVTPQQALLPLLIIVFGTDLKFRVVIVGLFCFYFPLVNTVAGVQTVDAKYVEATRAFCTPRRRVLWVLWIPAVLPHIVAGIRLGFGMALTAMILAELWISSGTGYVLTDLGNAHELDTYYAVVFAITIFAICGNELLRRLEKRLRSWDRPSEPTRVQLSGRGSS
jgi:ABC-type nitrate/sulfonate/bicarbonate transport system permease component